MHLFGNIEFPPQVKQLLRERMPTLYGLPEGAMVHENEVDNPPESIPSSQPSLIITTPSHNSQKLLVAKAKRVAKSGVLSQA